VVLDTETSGAGRSFRGAKILPRGAGRRGDHDGAVRGAGRLWCSGDFTPELRLCSARSGHRWARRSALHMVTKSC
jgi:hypothetical protein